MALKAGNLIVFGTEARNTARLIKVIGGKAMEAGKDLELLPGLSAAAAAEVEAIAVGRVSGLVEANRGVKVLQELFKTATPLVKKIDDPNDPDVGMFVEVDASGAEVIPRNVVINPGLL